MDPEMRTIMLSGTSASGTPISAALVSIQFNFGPLCQALITVRRARGLKCASRAGPRATVKALSRVAGVMVFAGLLAGLLGIGGALIFNPVLLQLGVQPQVST